MKSKIKYSNEPLGMVEIVSDFLPSLALVREEQPMSTVETIEQAIQALPPGELARFRNWFAKFDASAWDKQIEADATAGRLDRIAEEAIEEYGNGKAREL
ncbi:MAG: hypothetical protein ABI132_12500 [Rhodanobacteraceae bacterium]